MRSIAKNETRMTVKVYDQFERMPPEALELCTAASHASLYLHPAWFGILLQSVFHKDRIRLYTVEQNGATSAVLPTRHSYPGVALQSLTNFYSSYYAPIVQPDCADGVLLELAQFLKMEQPVWDSLEFASMPRESPVFMQWQRALEQAGYIVQPFFCFGNWYSPVAGRSFSQYYQSLPSQLKNTIKRRRAKLARHAPIRMRILTGGAELDQAIEDYLIIYRASWKKKDEPFPLFIPTLIHTAAREGWLRLGLAYVNDEPAAAQIWLVHAGIANIFKLAYAQKFRGYSVGSLLSLMMFEQAIDDDRVLEIDYLSGDDAYKKDWMSHRRERWGIAAYRVSRFRRVLGVVRHVYRSHVKARFTPNSSDFDR